MLSVFHLYDMVTYWRQERCAHLSCLQCKRLFFKFLQGLVLGNPRQCTAVACRPKVIRILTCHIRKISPFYQGVVYGVYTRLCCLLFLSRSLLAKPQQDMCRFYESFRSDTVFLVFIYSLCLFEHLVVGNNLRHQLFVSVESIFFSE